MIFIVYYPHKRIEPEEKETLTVLFGTASNRDS